jgi:CheY-like chemotaxis protein
MIRAYIAEDDPLDRKDVEMTFEESLPGHKPTFFENGETLIARLNEPPFPDYILLDMGMPVVDGFEVFSFLSKHRDEKLRNIPVLVMSSSKAHEEIVVEKGCSPVAFVRKPLSSNELLNALDAHL